MGEEQASSVLSLRVGTKDEETVVRKIALGIGLAVAAFTIAIHPASADGDAIQGETIYKAKCRMCHTIEPGQHRVGPSLFGIVGRRCGEVPEKPFPRYSPGYKAVCEADPFAWSEDRLMEYIADPSGYLSTLAGRTYRSPMTMKLPDADDRTDIIAYLRTLK